MDHHLLRLSTGIRVAYTDRGSGRPIVLLHGMCMSSLFFERNVDELAQNHRVVAFDFRGHGRSPAVEGGHTVERYAQDLRALLLALDLESAILVGWSMGALVLWEYLSRFTTDSRVSGVVVVSQNATDLSEPGWPYGACGIRELQGYLGMAQSDFAGFLGVLVPAMFKHELPDVQRARFVSSASQIGANAGTVIFVDQTLRDYREALASFDTPHLLVWGADEKIVQVGSGEWIRDRLPSAELHVFEDSGHCPMWEEPGRFNAVLEEWVARL